MEYLVVSIYIISLLFIFLFSLGQLHLTWHYLKNKKKQTTANQPILSCTDLPVVTVQLPVYNELYVVKRLIMAICHLNYPQDKLEIQVLDDSTDETKEIIAGEVAQFTKKGIDIKQLRRTGREGFKAGALQYGLEHSKGKFIAVFDADFLPDENFLLNTIPHFNNEQVGLVQARWGHVNQNYSLLTRLQAFGLDAHFSIEQTGRNVAGSFINFNGTAGVWRKTCIIDAGGWSADTLTEDLDLSYRAQLKKWKFKYLEDVVAPAELPVLMPAVKSQQYRWNKGAAETARKNLGKVFTSDIGLIHKAHAVFHLLNSSIFIFLLLAAISSIPMLFIKNAHPGLNFIFNLGSIFLVGFFSIGFFYWIASKKMTPKTPLKYFFSTFPPFLIVSMGLSFHNAMAVLEGYWGYKTPFIRTPKFNITRNGDSWKGNVYINPGISLLTLLEGGLSLYFIFGIAAGIYFNDYALMLFHIMLSVGFAAVFYFSLKTAWHG